MPDCPGLVGQALHELLVHRVVGYRPVLSVTHAFAPEVASGGSRRRWVPAVVPAVVPLVVAGGGAVWCAEPRCSRAEGETRLDRVRAPRARKAAVACDPQSSLGPPLVPSRPLAHIHIYIYIYIERERYR